ncbi:MAG: OsmC family protein [Gammaproteobacteria bacterium]
MAMNNFKEMLERKQRILTAQPEKAHVEVRADSRLIDGFESKVEVRKFTVTVDQSKGSGGADKAPRPSEYVLAALAACHEVTYRLYADFLDIPLHSVSVSVTGVSDARGFLGPVEGIRPGFHEVRGTINIDSPASDEDIERLRQTVNQHCPVLDDLRSPISVELEVSRK